MAAYSLTIAIDSEGLQKINQAGQVVTLVKSSSVAGPLPVAWIVFKPFKNNTVTWKSEFLMYASMTQIQSGATISEVSTTDNNLVLGHLYNFTSDNVFIDTGAGGTQGKFSLTNNSGSTLTFGLNQSATINGSAASAPLNAVAVLPQEKVDFTVEETVSIFLSAYSNNGTVISEVSSTALQVPLTSISPSAKIGFDDKTSQFFLA